jgi:hypothetical protein
MSLNIESKNIDIKCGDSPNLSMSLQPKRIPEFKHSRIFCELKTNSAVSPVPNGKEIKAINKTIKVEV